MLYVHWQQFVHLEKLRCQNKTKQKVVARSQEWNRTDVRVSPEGGDALRSVNNSLAECKWTNNLTSLFQEQKTLTLAFQNLRVFKISNTMPFTAAKPTAKVL